MNILCHPTIYISVTLFRLHIAITYDFLNRSDSLSHRAVYKFMLQASVCPSQICPLCCTNFRFYISLARPDVISKIRRQRGLQLYALHL